MITIGTTALRLAVLAAAAALTLALAAPALADPPGDWRREGVVVVSDAAATSSVRPDDRAVRTGPPTGATDPGIVASTTSGDEGVFDWSDVLVALAVGALGIVAVATVRNNGRLRKA